MRVGVLLESPKHIREARVSQLFTLFNQDSERLYTELQAAGSSGLSGG